MFSTQCQATTMSTIFTLTTKDKPAGTKSSEQDSILSCNFDPPIYLDENSQYVMGLLNFETYNSIPNISKNTGNIFQLTGRQPIEIPDGSYEINDISEYIQTKLNPANKEYLLLKGSNSTLKTLIKSSHEIDFTAKNSIGSLLGFEHKKYSSNVWHMSEKLTQIMKINSILIHCNLTQGSFKNGKPSHVIHQFFPTVPPGFKIVECPTPVIYLPINTSKITEITIKILDQNEDLVSFAGEIITVGLHLKKL